MASVPKCPARALATHFGTTATLTGFDRIAFCQLGGRARERGLSRGQRCRFTGGRSARAPAPAGMPAVALRVGGSPPEAESLPRQAVCLLPGI